MNKKSIIFNAVCIIAMACCFISMFVYGYFENDEQSVVTTIDSQKSNLIILLEDHSLIEYKSKYRKVESNGEFGDAEYYLFDKQGKCYEITKDIFDSLVDIEIK